MGRIGLALRFGARFAFRIWSEADRVALKKARQYKRVRARFSTGTETASGDARVSVTQQQVLNSLAKVASPRGMPLSNANVLSAISVTDGKVFFSINVDAAEARAWESVRAQAEAAVRDSRCHRGDDRADGRAQARLAATCARAASACAFTCSRRATGRRAPPAARRGVADVEAGGDPGRRRRHRGGLGQGRRRQVDGRDQSGAGRCAISGCVSGCSTPTSTAPRCRGCPASRAAGG